MAAIIYTDIGRDGMLTGLNLDQTLTLAAAPATPVIASGGVGRSDQATWRLALKHGRPAYRHARIEPG